jgi:putative Mg2+ transporter-C (MgtC) family protein
MELILQNFIFQFKEFIELLCLYAPNLLSATLCGIIIGLEREAKQIRSDYSSVGLKTIALICIGACMFTTTSLLMSSEFINVDPTRIISYVIGGIGFIGAGAISKDTNRIRGATTAALIWVSTAIGIITGLGHIFLAPTLALGLVAITRTLNHVEYKLRDRHKEA